MTGKPSYPVERTSVDQRCSVRLDAESSRGGALIPTRPPGGVRRISRPTGRLLRDPQEPRLDRKGMMRIVPAIRSRHARTCFAGTRDGPRGCRPNATSLSSTTTVASCWRNACRRSSRPRRGPVPMRGHRGRQMVRPTGRWNCSLGTGPVSGLLREPNRGLASFNAVLARLEEPVRAAAQQRYQASPRTPWGRCWLRLDDHDDALFSAPQCWTFDGAGTRGCEGEFARASAWCRACAGSPVTSRASIRRI